MITLLVLLVVIQAALLLWTSIHLSNVFLRGANLAPRAWAILTGGAAIAIAIFGGTIDLWRALCRPGDCIILVLSVACVRLVAVNKEAERLELERAFAAQAATDAARARGRKLEAQQLMATAAILEARSTARPAGAPPSSPAASPPTSAGVTGRTRPPARSGT